MAVEDGTLYRFCELRFDGERGLSGTAIAYGDVAKMPWGEQERFEPGAFDNISGADVILNVQHDRVYPVARTGGGGLQLSDDNNALEMKAELADTGPANDTLELVRKRILRGLSIEFYPLEDRIVVDDDGNRVRVIEKAELRGIAVVDRPAYPNSLIQARSKQMSDELKRKLEEAERARDEAIRERDEARAERDTAIAERDQARADKDEAETRAGDHKKKMEEAEEKETKAKDDMKKMQEERDAELETARTETRELADLAHMVSPLLPEGSDAKAMSKRELLVAGAGDEVSDIENRSDDYLLARVEGIVERRAQANPPGGPNNPPQNHEGGVNVIRMIETRKRA